MATVKTLNTPSDPNLETICRLCLQYDAGSINIFHSLVPIPMRIMTCAAVEIRIGDGLPELICEKCRYQLEVSYYFRKKCQISNRKLKKHIRLLNLGKKSRVFSKPDDEDDADDEEQQYEESIKFIEEEDARRKAEQDEKNQKWLEEQREQFRREETQRLFEEFGMFIQSRSPTVAGKVKKEIINTVQPSSSKALPNNPPQLREQIYEIRHLQTRTVTPTKQQQHHQPDEHHDEPQPEVDADNEITSSEQVPDEQDHEQEQAIFYSDDGGEEEENSEMLVFDEKCNEEDDDVKHHDQEIVHIESNEETHMVESMEQEEEDVVEDVIDENEMENKDNDNDTEEMDEFIFLADLEDSDQCVERSDRVSEVESYQIEENGDIQYLKDERSQDDEINSNQMDSNFDSKYVIEDVTIINVDKFGEAVPVKLEKKKKLKKKTTPLRSEIVQLMNARVSTNDLKIFKCSECPQSFTRANSLIRHRSAHRAGREYCCDYCDKFFSCKSSLDRHIRIHTGEKPFTCDQCGKNFMQKEILKRHLTIHTGKRPHQCPHCPRSFVQKLLMKTHINAVHMEVPKIVKNVCHLCPKSFLHPSGLSRHLLTHKGMVFSCAECGRTFNDKSSLRRHFAVHSKSGSKSETKAEPDENESSNEYLT